MKTILLKVSVRIALFAVMVPVGAAIAQTPETTPAKRVNFGYSQNPKTKKKMNDSTPAPVDAAIKSPTATVGSAEPDQPAETIAKKTLEVVKNASKKALAPTEAYKVGVGDVLFINLQNSSKNSAFYTVLNDGTIDYPLAGELVQAAGLTTEEIEELLHEKVKLYENPQLSVKVRDYASHRITVLGLVEKSGEKFIQREAVPLFVVRAESIVQPNADRVIIRRAEGSVETISLSDEKSENTLIFPNDIVEFTSSGGRDSRTGQVRFFFIGGEVVAVGQKDFYDGMTLTQAILASGGLKKESIKKVVIRRKNAAGLLVSTEYNLRSVKDGKIPDPPLEAGDTIEVGN